jgi:hypothetical protein
MGILWSWSMLLLLTSMAGAMPAEAEDPTKPTNSLQHRSLTFLKSLPREWSGTSARDCKTYEDKNIDRLMGSFAESATAFLNAFRQTHGTVTITSAHRTAQEQTCVCIGEKGPCAGRPRVIKTKKKGPRIVVRSVSRHQLGIALDVRPGTGSEGEFTCLHEFAQLNPQFGVHFPLGNRDRPHMEPISRAGPVKLAGFGLSAPRLTACNRMKVMLTHDHVD